MRLFFARPACRRRAHILASPASSGLPIISGTPITIALIHDAGTAGTNILMRSPADYHLPRHRACAGRSAPPAHIPRKDRLRRILVVAERSCEGPLNGPTAVTQPCWRQPLFTPLSCPRPPARPLVPKGNESLSLGVDHLVSAGEQRLPPFTSTDEYSGSGGISYTDHTLF